MIQIAWHCTLLIIAIIIGFIWAITRDDYDGGYLGISSQFIAIVVWIILTIMAVAIYGGIFWW